MTERDVLAEIAAIRARLDDGQDARDGDDAEPLPATVGPFAPTGGSGPLRWAVLVAVAVVGGALFALLPGQGTHAALSYLCGLLGAVAAFEIGAFNIRLVDRYYPHLTLVAAMLSYLVTALALALVLAASNPRVVDAKALAVGLGSGVTLWLSGMVWASRVRLEQPSEPDNISAQHGRNI